jgi:hypothetical protein
MFKSWWDKAIGEVARGPLPPAEDPWRTGPPEEPQGDSSLQFWRAVTEAGHLDCGEWSAVAPCTEIRCGCGAVIPLEQP